MKDTGSTDKRDSHGAEVKPAIIGAKRNLPKSSNSAADRAVAARPRRGGAVGGGWARGAALATLALGLGGCSTAGPAHLYLFTPSADVSIVQDLEPQGGREQARVPAYTLPGERVLGLAYDPFTDHLFIRLDPGNFVRVVDRPARAVKRDFFAAQVPTRGGGDLAIRSRDRNLFFNDPTDAALVETTLFGEFVRKISLAGLTAPAQGVAYDARRDEFLILPAAAGTRLLRYGLDGRALSALDLEQPVRGDALAYDSVEQSSYATLADGSAIGVFDGHGRLLRCLPLTDPTDTRLFDVGPRSFLRLF